MTAHAAGIVMNSALSQNPSALTSALTINGKATWPKLEPCIINPFTVEISPGDGA